MSHWQKWEYLGLKHYGKTDKEIWDEFYGNWDSLVDESQKYLKDIGSEKNILKDNDSDIPALWQVDAPSEKMASVPIRLRQAFFRNTVLSSYDNSCCLCGTDISELLIASHIIPWSVREDIRTDPQNGLALCVLHDKAFDRGLISICCLARVGLDESE